MDNLPYFKYQPNIYDSDYVIYKGGVCQCCGKQVNAYIGSMYCKKNIDCICLRCVADGAAAKKFNGTFIQDVAQVLDKEKTDELFNRTPGYCSWQGEYWLACCDDYCAYIGDVGTKELDKLGITDEVINEYEALNRYTNIREHLTAKGSMAGYLFRCLHCGKYHLWVDAD